ncbi:uncharacterized protein LOC144146381 [Haemaphysalis longicornis]
MPRTPPDVIPERPSPVHTPVHRCSRRKLGLPPEQGPLLESTSRRHASQPEVMAQAMPTTVTFQQPREPAHFHGEDYEDVEDWLEQFERVAAFNQWSATQKLQQAYFALEDGARTWFENWEASLRTWEDFRREVQAKFANADRREQAQRLLEARTQKPNESVAMFAEDMARLFKRADPDMAECKKLRHLMHGVKEQLFAGLVRNPPRTVQEFIREATAIERALQQRSRQYDRTGAKTSSSISAVMATDDDNRLRDLIRAVLREELAKCGIIPSGPIQASVADIDVEDWLDHYERVSSFNRWDDCLKLRHVGFYLDLIAETWYHNNERDLPDWQRFTSELRRVFGASSMRTEAAKKKLDERVQRPVDRLSLRIQAKSILTQCHLLFLRSLRTATRLGIFRDPSASIAASGGMSPASVDGANKTKDSPTPPSHKAAVSHPTNTTPNGLCEKFLPRYIGPYTIVEQTSPVNYRVTPNASVTDRRCRGPETVHVSRLKPFFSRSTHS